MKIEIYQTRKNYYFKEIEYKIGWKSYNIFVDENKKYQEIIGFGGAITESSAYVYSLLSEEQKKEFINSLYSSSGLNYSLGRLVIGSCDFSLKSYTYLDSEIFSIEHEKTYVFPLLNDIKKVKDIEFIASCWSPISKYKTNGELLHGGKLKKENYADHAKYLVNYIKEMGNNGVFIKYMTIQNEPQAKQVWESCIFSSIDEAEFSFELNKELNKENLNTKIFIWDHNKDIILKRVMKTIGFLQDSSFIYGVAYHWYDNGSNYNLKLLHEEYPSLKLLFTEGCIEGFYDKTHTLFEQGIRYAHEYISDINYYSNGFIDWNILLDEKGGPTHAKNYCKALVQFDTKKKKLIYNPAYYFVKHISSFLKQNANRIYNVNTTNIEVATLQNKDGSIVVILLNTKRDKIINVKVKEEIISFKSKKNSITTLIIE